MVKVGDKLLFNYGAHFPTKVGTVRSIVSSRYSKGGAFADVGDIMLPGETTVNGSPIGVFLT